MKGVLICGGTGSRLRPLTEITNKSLLPVYDKPLLLYPLQILLDAGIQEIAIITGPEHMEQMTAFLGSGERFGCQFTYTVQEKPGGIAQALGLAEAFVGDDSICAILGDNIFFDDLSSTIKSFKSGAHIFLKEVEDPERFGVAKLTGIVEARTIVGNEEATKQSQYRYAEVVSVESLEEKPVNSESNFAVTGCYLYDKRCFDLIRNLAPSPRGELEITDLSKCYLADGSLKATILQKEWIDAGTFESLFRAAELVRNQRNDV